MSGWLMGDRMFGMATKRGEEYELLGHRFDAGFMESALKLSPAKRELVLATLANAYTRLGRFEDGLVMDRLLVAHLPSDAIVRYNLACSLSLTGRVEEAIQELLKAVALGYSGLAEMESDPDLVEARNHPLWPAVIEALVNPNKGRG